MSDGKSAEELLGKGIGYTYNDLVILPRQIHFAIDDVNLTTHITRNISIKTLHDKHTNWLETEDNVLTIDATLDFIDQSNGLMESYVKEIMDKFID